MKYNDFFAILHLYLGYRFFVISTLIRILKFNEKLYVFIWIYRRPENISNYQQMAGSIAPE